MTIVAFDFDGTLADSEMTVLLAVALDERRPADAAAGPPVADRMAEITRRAMNDELAYGESLRRRVALLEGLPLDAVEAALAGVTLRPGAAGLLADLRAAGHAVVVLTGGFERGVRAAIEREGAAVDEVVANRLVDDGRALTGGVEGPLVDGAKDAAFADVADRLGVDLASAVAVGDGANDLPMLAVAGLAVGFDPTPAVAPRVDEAVDSVPALRSLFERRGLL